MKVRDNDCMGIVFIRNFRFGQNLMNFWNFVVFQFCILATVTSERICSGLCRLS